MARLIKVDERHPVQITEKDVGRWFCMCGLSKTRPFCDGSHRVCAAEMEGKVYQYKESEMSEAKKKGCCGGVCKNKKNK